MPSTAELFWHFEETGYLPSGIHDFSLPELGSLLCFNEHRRKMWLQMASFLSFPALSPHFSHFFLGGGFVSKKEDPLDIDLVLETMMPYGPEALASIARFFALGLEPIQKMYGVHLHFWMQDCPSFLSDYRTFFQYDRRADSGFKFDASRGVARLELKSPEVLSHLRAAIRGETPRDGSLVAPLEVRELPAAR